MPSRTFADRPLNKLVLFDVDGTLTPARQVCTHLTMFIEGFTIYACRLYLQK